MKKTTILLPTKEFKVFLRSLSKINDGVILKIKDYSIIALTATNGGSMTILSQLKLDEIPENNIDIELPINEVSKLIKICDFNPSDTLSLTINDNIIKYKNDDIKLKLHLAEKSIISVPASITPERFNRFPICFNATIDKSKLTQLEKGYNFIKKMADDMKIYFYIENKTLYGEITDYSSKSTDSFRVALTEQFTGTFNGRLPIKFDNWCLTDLPNNEIIFEASEIKARGITYNSLLIRQNSNNLKYAYLIQALVQ